MINVKYSYLMTTMTEQPKALKQQYLTEVMKYKPVMKTKIVRLETRDGKTGYSQEGDVCP